ncbi:MAG: hypothetical protein WC796_05415 [Candidatus Pacearchaeota archaeon]|jgi:hypothetical protein
MNKNSTKFAKLAIVIILIVYAVVVASTTIIKYHVEPLEAYKINSTNLVDDGSFENFNQTAGDCCNYDSNASKVYATSSNIAFEGTYSLKLYSENQCACIPKQINNWTLDHEYILNFYYKGDNPRICLWSWGLNKCVLEKTLVKESNWTYYGDIFKFPENTTGSHVAFYTDSTGELRTNYYDALEVKQITPMSVKGPFLDNEKYIIRTNPENKVNGEKLGDEEGWFVIQGKPSITLKIPYTEIIIILIIMLIVARLIFKIDKNEW